MADCGAKSKPFCQIKPNFSFQSVGTKDYGDFSHSTGHSISLTTPSRTTPLLTMRRDIKVSWNDYSKCGGYVCSKQVPESLDVQLYWVTEGCVSEYDCLYDDNETITENDILFLDLRHDILVRKETAHTVKISDSSDKSTIWNPSNSTVKVHAIQPGDPDVLETVKLFINNEQIDVTVASNYSENPYVYTFPAYNGLPQNNTQLFKAGVDDLYYIWDEHKDEDGGFDLYYPEYRRGFSSIADYFDVNARNRHRALIGIVPYDREPVSGTLNSFDPLTYSDTAERGSWAVSPIKYQGSNLKAFTTQKLTNGFTTTLYPLATVLKDETQDSATNRVLGNPTEIPCPIAPL